MFFYNVRQEEPPIGKDSHHPHKEINAAIEVAIQNGWVYTKSKGHAAGRLKCQNKNKCHQMSIWSTPKNPYDHAKRILKAVNKCSE